MVNVLSSRSILQVLNSGSWGFTELDCHDWGCFYQKEVNFEINFKNTFPSTLSFGQFQRASFEVASKHRTPRAQYYF